MREKEKGDVPERIRDKWEKEMFCLVVVCRIIID